MRTSSLRFAPNRAGACRMLALAFIATGVAAALAKQHPRMPNKCIMRITLFHSVSLLIVRSVTPNHQCCLFIVVCEPN